MRNDFLIDTESARFVSKETVKNSNCTHKDRPTSAGSGDRFSPKMMNADSIAKTQKLLDQAIASAWHTVKSDRRLPILTPIHWVWQLAASYHLTHTYPLLIKEASGRFAAFGRTSLAQWAAHKAKEETGHDRLALLDIQSMGYKAEAVVEALIPISAVVLVNYLTQSVYAQDPIGCVGYSYTLERLATGIKEKHIQSVEALLPSDIVATRCLRVHSSVGADVEHMEETLEMVAGLAAQERHRVAIACYETALLYFSPPEEDYISDKEVQHMLKPLESRTRIQPRVDIQCLT
ncbi:hypothetical protein LC605_13765 [Nostoc sp. CHAB 5836]|uniref:hypothetical protein n=1 Tax=Nostoc sp. CHAB 5836 TaxID=2780404 RepID=UPI001E59FABB|nr:hypothetical protein [Nostoc sp. CHAB 5836]MCC5616114.1 hypothetical protein [Nostoc sp. CHAB 5836]